MWKGKSLHLERANHYFCKEKCSVKSSAVKGVFIVKITMAVYSYVWGFQPKGESLLSESASHSFH